MHAVTWAARISRKHDVQQRLLTLNKIDSLAKKTTLTKEQLQASKKHQHGAYGTRIHRVGWPAAPGRAPVSDACPQAQLTDLVIKANQVHESGQAATCFQSSPVA